MQTIETTFPGLTLTHADRTYCNHLHHRYIKRFGFLNELYTHNTIKSIHHKNDCPAAQDPYPAQIKELEKLMAGLEKLYKGTNHTFILTLEQYFRDLYALRIPVSYTRKHTSQDLLIMSCDPIIINIILNENADWLLIRTTP